MLRESTARSPDPDEMRSAMRTLASGIGIVSVATGQSVRGMTANSITSVCLSPPTLLVCLDVRSTTFAMIESAGHSGISLLSSRHQHVADVFARRSQEGLDPFASGDWAPGVFGDPLLQHALVSFDLEVAKIDRWFDHAVVFGKIANIGAGDSAQAPLVYHGGRYSSAITL